MMVMAMAIVAAMVMVMTRITKEKQQSLILFMEELVSHAEMPRSLCAALASHEDSPPETGFATRSFLGSAKADPTCHTRCVGSAWRWTVASRGASWRTSDISEG